MVVWQRDRISRDVLTWCFPVNWTKNNFVLLWRLSSASDIFMEFSRISGGQKQSQTPSMNETGNVFPNSVWTHLMRWWHAMENHSKKRRSRHQLTVTCLLSSRRWTWKLYCWFWFWILMKFAFAMSTMISLDNCSMGTPKRYILLWICDLVWIEVENEVWEITWDALR